MNYKEALFKVEPAEPGNEILIAELAEAGFESFEITSEGLKAWISEPNLNPELVIEIIERYEGVLRVEYAFGDIETINWNEEWEKNYSPVVICNRCGIRAPFHPERPDLEFDIVIEPKMSFGTAHHNTTALMIEWLLETDVEGLSVLDMGCGTGILAILAALKGAVEVVAVDNYVWAYENTIENAERNAVDNIKAIHGDVVSLKELPDKFHLILANINRNVLLEDMNEYLSSMRNEGRLLMSGFLAEDAPCLEAEAERLGLTKVGVKVANNWYSLLFKL